MTGVTDLPSLSLLDINRQRNQSDPELKLRETHFGLPSQKAIGEFVEFLSHWRMPWDDETQTFYEFDHFADIRQQTKNLNDDEPPMDVAKKDSLTPAEIQLLQTDRYQLYFRGKVLSVTDLFTKSLEQGLTKKDVVDRCGFAEWEKILSHLRHKQSFRKMRAVISEAQRMQFENYMEKFSQEDFYLYLEYKTYLSWESEQYERDKVVWKERHDGLQSDIQECESRVEELTASIAQKTKRQKRLSFLKRKESKDSGEASAIAIELGKLTALKESTEAQAETCRQQLAKEAKKHTELIDWQKTIKWHSDELTLLELRQQLEINLTHMKRIDDARVNEYSEEQQQRIDARYVVLQEENEKYRAKIQAIAARLEPQSSASQERSAEEPQYGKFHLPPTALQYLAKLKTTHPALPEEFKTVRDVLLTQSTLVNYTGEELHQHFRLRLQPFRQFISVSKIEFEDRVSRSWWRRLLNIFRNIWYGWIHKDTEETFRRRYSLVKQEYHQQMHQWADAVLSRFEANEHTHLAAMSSETQYSDVAVNAYQSLEKMNVALPRLHVIESEQERDPRTAYVVKSRQDLTPETMTTLRRDLRTYLHQIGEDILTLQRKQDKAEKKNDIVEGRTAQDYQDEIEKLELTRDKIVERQKAIPCLAKPADLTEEEMQTETWVQDPEILLAVNTVQQDLSKKPEHGKSLLDQLNHRGEPEWLASASKKLENAKNKLAAVQETQASNPVYIKIVEALDKLQEDYDLAKLRSDVKVSRDQEIDAMIAQPSSSETLYLRQERCRRAAMALEGRDRSADEHDHFDSETFYPPELAPKLLEAIGDGKLLTPEGRFDPVKTKHILTVINECIAPEYRPAMMELMKCLVNRDDAYETLHVTLAPLTKLVLTQPPLIERLWKSYFIPRLQETGNVDLARCIQKLSPHLIADFMKAQSQNTTWAIDRVKLLLEQPRTMGQSLTTDAVVQNWELIDDQLLSDSVKWVNLADGLGQLAAVDRALLQRKFQAFAATQYDGAATDYHRLYSAPLATGDALQTYWKKRQAFVVKTNPADLTMDQHFFDTLGPQGLAEVESALIGELQKNTLSKEDGLLRLAAICPGNQISMELVDLYQRAYHAKQFHICTKLITTLKGETLKQISLFHQTCLREDLLEIRPLTEHQRNCISHTAEGKLLIEQTRRAAGVLEALKGSVAEVVAPQPGKWIETFGRLNLVCIFEYLELLPTLKIPSSTLKFIESHFTQQKLDDNKSDLDSEYVLYHNIIEALDRAQVRFYFLSTEPALTKLNTIKDHFKRWQSKDENQFFELILANLKENPVILSEFFQYLRDEFLTQPNLDLVRALFERLNQQDMISLDHLKPYGAKARHRLESELRTSIKFPNIDRDIETTLTHLRGPNLSDFFREEVVENHAIFIGKYATTTARSALLCQAASAVLKCEDGVLKSLLKQFCFAVSAPYEALKSYQDSLTVFQTYQKSQDDLQQALSLAKCSEVKWTDFSNTSLLSSDIYKEAFQLSIREALAIDAKPIEAVNRLLSLSGFALAIPAEPKLLEECGALLLEQLKCLMKEDSLDPVWLERSLKSMAEALRSMPTLPHHGECMSVIEQAKSARELYQRYVNGSMKGQLSGLSFDPKEADTLATVFPQVSLIKLQEQLALVAGKIHDKTDPSCKILEIFSERLHGERHSDADTLYKSFQDQRADALKQSPCYSLVDRLSKNLVIVDLLTPTMVRDLLMHMPLQTQMDSLRFITYRIYNLVFNTLNLSDKPQGMNTLICPSPDFTRRCSQQLGALLDAFSILDPNGDQNSKVRYDVADDYITVKFLQLGRADRVTAKAMQSCMTILGEGLTSGNVNERLQTVLFPQSKYDPATTPDATLWVQLRQARIRQLHKDPVPPTETFTELDVLSAQYRHLKTVLLSNSYLSKLMEVQLEPELHIDRVPKESDRRSQAYHAREVLDKIYLVDSLQDPNSFEALQKGFQTFKQAFVSAHLQNRPMPCGEYFAALVIGHYERSKGKTSFAKAIGLDAALDSFIERERLILVDQKPEETRTADEKEFWNRKQVIRKVDDECAEHFMTVTLPQSRQSEALSAELHPENITEEIDHAQSVPH